MWAFMKAYADNEVALQKAPLDEKLLQGRNIFRATANRIPVSFRLVDNVFADFLDCMQKKEAAGTLGNVEGHTDWGLVKEVAALTQDLLEAGYPHSATNVADLFGGSWGKHR